MNEKKEYVVAIKNLGFNKAFKFINIDNKTDVIQWEFREDDDFVIKNLFGITESMIVFQQPVLFSATLSPFHMILWLKNDKIEFFSEGRGSFWESGKIKPIEEIIQNPQKSVVISFTNFVDAIKMYYLEFIKLPPVRGNETVWEEIKDDLENHFKEFESIYNDYIRKRKINISRAKESDLDDFLYSRQVLWSQGKIKDYSKKEKELK